MKTITLEINANVYEDWPSKCLLVAANLSVKYVILYKIREGNWNPSSHGSFITHSLVGLLYQIGTHDAFYFGEYVFVQYFMHAESYIGNLPIDIIYLIYGIYSNQKNYIVTYGSETGASRGL